MYKLTYIEPARQDVQAAKSWYKKQSLGLEQRLVESIKSTLQFVQKYPLAHSVRYRNMRVAYTKIFPYSIHFLVQESSNRIVVLAIIHIKRSPEATQGRTV